MKKNKIFPYQDNIAVTFALDYVDRKRLEILVENGIEVAHHLSGFVSCTGSE